MKSFSSLILSSAILLFSSNLWAQSFLDDIGGGSGGKSCGCENVKVVCLSKVDLFLRCGPNARACAFNNSNGIDSKKIPDELKCSIFMSEDDCVFADIISDPNVPRPIDELASKACSEDILESNIDGAIRALQNADACCTLKHELGHARAPDCTDDVKERMCLEVESYNTSSSCLGKAAGDFCRLYREDYPEACSWACNVSTWFKVNESKNRCKCSNAESSENVNCVELCQAEITTADVPPECAERKDDEEVREILDAMCVEVPTPSPSASESPSPEESESRVAPKPPEETPTPEQTVTPTPTTSTPMPTYTATPQMNSMGYY